ncbi:TldD/PmbA family protein [Bacteriovorax sp. DB6_IX]|uniref:TldD/PmbA family protein n=1 Tax=Bacteriovorax sp. DB6_IX TaxID=1353530 RepID=UPI00038A2603|nr:TldD/PmbA family protein [Bacteriovorax sp. DB6_IX]EQC50720.1 TldD/PmbA family protein [Bacteriovorax sp. DB6_IX]
MLNSQVAKEVIDYALLRGADFAELFVDKQTFETFGMKSSEINDIQTGINFGIGVRLFYGTKVLYGYTNSTNKDDLIEIVKSLSAKDLRDPMTTLNSFDYTKYDDRHPVIQGLLDNISLEQKLPFLLELDKQTRSISDKIEQVTAGVSQYLQQIEIFNSEGLHTSDMRNYSRIRATAIAKDGSVQDTGSYSPGAMMGWNFIQAMDPKMISEQIAQEALVKLKAEACPAGEMPVVIDNGFGGVIFHEACGHLLETTSVAKKASVFHDKLGEMIASSVVSAVDDGTLENHWGSINIDDEGMPSKKTQLIKDGKLTSFMVDKLGAMKTGYERTGSGRRESYKYAPTSRMRNTYIEAGDSSLEQMISSVDKGLYCKKMGGGSVSPGTGEFNFAAQECYLIENGKISTPVKGATLIGSGPQSLKEISMVGNNLDFAAGVCGSVSGGVFVTVGQPAIKVDNILVGGGK